MVGFINPGLADDDNLLSIMDSQRPGVRLVRQDTSERAAHV